MRTGKVPSMDGKRAFLSALLTAVVACGGAAPATGGAGASAGASVATSSAPSTAATAAGSAAASGPKLSDVLAAAKLSQYKITYKVTATGQGAEALNGEQTWYSKPPKARFDFNANFSGQSMLMSFFSLPDGNVYCITLGGSPQCFASGAGVGSPLDSNFAVTAQQQMLSNPSSFGATFKENKTIAGQAGLCYAVTGSTGTFSGGTFCYTKDGLTLLSQFTASGTSIAMEATNVSTTVPDSDFTLPAKPLGR